MNQTVKRSEGTHISFRFHPYLVEKGGHVVEKVERGQRRRYLRGISSGIKTDGDGERMTSRCIKSMHRQGRSGNVLLYAGLHGVNFLDDLGILTSSDIIQDRDWLTEYRLYDEGDSMVDESSIQRANKLYAQIMGLEPYKKPIQKGFSIEGTIPTGAILDMKQGEDGSFSHRVIDDIALDGVLVVNRPAYGDSVVTAVYKALGELPPQAVAKIHKNLHAAMADRLRDEENARSFYQQWYLLNDVVQDEIEKVMRISDNRKAERLEILLDEYKAALIPLILQNEEHFKPDPIAVGGAGEAYRGERPAIVDQALATLAEKSLILTSILRRRTGGKG